jgi:hypothetical protein
MAEEEKPHRSTELSLDLLLYTVDTLYFCTDKAAILAQRLLRLDRAPTTIALSQQRSRHASRPPLTTVPTGPTDREPGFWNGY